MKPINDPDRGPAVRRVRRVVERLLGDGTAVARAASFYLKNVGWTLEEVSPPDDLHRWAVLRTPAVPDVRPYDHFVDF